MLSRREYSRTSVRDEVIVGIALQQSRTLSAAQASLGSSGDGIEEVGILPIKLRENKKSDVKVGADECFLIVTFIFQTILNLVVVHLR